MHIIIQKQKQQLRDVEVNRDEEYFPDNLVGNLHILCSNNLQVEVITRYANE